MLLNKIDRIPTLPFETRQSLRTLAEWEEHEPGAIAMSALTGAGLEDLRARVRDLVTGGPRRRSIRVPIANARLIDVIEKRCTVVDRNYTDIDVELIAEIGDRQIEALLPLGEAFLVDGVDPRPKQASWGVRDARRRSPHLVAPTAIDALAADTQSAETTDDE